MSTSGTEHKAQRQRFFDRIYTLTREIPAGEVASYGQIAFVVGSPTARIVGFAMATIPDGVVVPWQRVVNSQGTISARRGGGSDPKQRELLAAEGIVFNDRGKLNFRIHGWRGPSWEFLETHGYDIGELIERSASLRRTGVWSRWGL